jgi:hypothetical protein
MLRLLHLTPGYRRLMRDGTLGKALVTRVDELQSGTIGVSRWKVRLTVKFDDGTTAEITRRIASHDLKGNYVDTGDVLPVRYDPADHGRVEVDFATYVADYERRVAALDGERLRAAERDFE